MNTLSYHKKRRDTKGLNMRIAALACCSTLLLTGCAAPFSKKEPLENVTELTVGSSMKVTNINQSYTLTADNSTLAADGLFYVSWGLGEHEPFKNSAGETVDLYDANL